MTKPEQDYTVSVATTHDSRGGTGITVSLVRRTGSSVGELLRHFRGINAADSADRYATKLQRVADIMNPSPVEVALRKADAALDVAQGGMDSDHDAKLMREARRSVQEALRAM